MRLEPFEYFNILNQDVKSRSMRERRILPINPFILTCRADLFRLTF
jgi:hypothetical protein